MPGLGAPLPEARQIVLGVCSGKRHMRGLCAKSCTASRADLGRVVERALDSSAEQWAPKSTPLALAAA